MCLHLLSPRFHRCFFATPNGLLQELNTLAGSPIARAVMNHTQYHNESHMFEDFWAMLLFLWLRLCMILLVVVCLSLQ